jgi:hypothetical protein
MHYIYDEYRKLLQAFLVGGYRIVTVREAATAPIEPPFVVLRHDVEWSAERARRLAEIEAQYGVRSTMYFRVDTRAFDLRAMLRLQERGFDIGYHYNTLDRAKGATDAARELFECDIVALRAAGIDVTTAVPHGNPSVRRRGYTFNSDLLQRDSGLIERLGLLDCGRFGTRLPLQGDVFQISDANLRWNHGEITWPFFFRVAHERSIGRLYLLTHADYWSESLPRATALQSAAFGLRAMHVRSSARRFHEGPWAWRRPRVDTPAPAQTEKALAATQTDVHT